MPSPVHVQPIPKTYLDTDTALTANSDVKVPTQKAVKAYVDALPANPVKATGAEVDTGTDDAKFMTPKAIEDSSYVKSTGNIATATALATPRAINGVDFDGSAPITIPDIILTAEPASDHLAKGVKIALTAGADLNFGDVGYIKSDGKVGLIDADAIATMSGLVMCCDASIANNASGNFLVLGVARDDTWAWTVGGLIYATVTGTTGNTLSQTAPTGTDDVVQIIGVATHADRILFNPQLVQIELV